MSVLKTFVVMPLLASLWITNVWAAEEEGEPTVGTPSTSTGPTGQLDYGLEPDRILEFATISANVYHRPDSEAYKGCKQHYESRYGYVHWSVYSREGWSKPYMVLRDDVRKIQVFCVAGTESFGDWKRNAQYSIKKNLAGIRVHRKFRELAVGLYRELARNHLKIGAGYKTYGTGHSLGGAAALMIGLQIEDQSPGEMVKVCTFGQPKITNYKPGSAAESGIYQAKNFPLLRVVNEGDPVPQFPPYSVVKDINTGRYSHFGDELIFKNGAPRFETFLDGAGEVIRARIDVSDPNVLWGTMKSALDGGNRSKHNMATYIKNIKTLVQ